VAAVLGAASVRRVRRELLLVATGARWVPGAQIVQPVAVFVTAAYDESVWESERLHGHSEARIGSLDPDGRLEPVVRPGTRLDVEVGGQVLQGRLHVGALVIDDHDVFAAAS
jgi:hypothetical protein